MHHPWNVAAYVLTELEEGAMLDLFEVIHFVQWCQVNALLTSPKKDSIVRRVIMDLSWSHPMDISIIACTPKDRYMCACKKMTVPTASDPDQWAGRHSS